MRDWDEQTETWLPTGMQTLAGPDKLLVCATSHLTIFAGIV